MANTAHPLAQAGRSLDPIQRQAAIENALAMALHFMRQPCDGAAQQAANLWAATARTNRALSLLKAASADACTTGRG